MPEKMSSTNAPGPRMEPSAASLSPRASARRLSFFGVAVAAFAMLLWARLLLVTGHPRTAIAEPGPVPASDVVTATVSSPGE